MLPTKDKDGHYIMIKESIQGKDVTLSHIYGHNKEHLTYKQI